MLGNKGLALQMHTPEFLINTLRKIKGLCCPFIISAVFLAIFLVCSAAGCSLNFPLSATVELSQTSEYIATELKRSVYWMDMVFCLLSCD